jgi:hypothetical protein
MLINEEVLERLKKKNFFNERDYSVKGEHFFLLF